MLRIASGAGGTQGPANPGPARGLLWPALRRPALPKLPLDGEGNITRLSLIIHPDYPSWCSGAARIAIRYG